MKFITAVESVRDKSLDKYLTPLYGDLKKARERYQHLLTKFSDIFGIPEDIEVFSAPGRTELGGNHTDHQNGHVLAASISSDAICAAARNEKKSIKLYSDGFGICEINLNELAPNPDNYGQTSELLRGIAAETQSRGYELRGLDLYVNSEVLPGSGLSSSAALEMVIGTAFNHIFCSAELSPMQIAQIGQIAENKYYGKPCGLMDQAACVFGGVIAIDFKNIQNPRVEKIDADFKDFKLIMVDSGADHAGLTDAYAAIRNDMEKVAAFFKKDTLSQVSETEFLENFAHVRESVGDLAVLRALHYYGDDKRASLEADALKAKDITKFLAYVNESGRSSFMYLNNVTVPGVIQKRDLAVTLALCGQILGEKGAFRVHGGGFAGAGAAFVPANFSSEFITRMNTMLNREACHAYEIRKEGGVKVF